MAALPYIMLYPSDYLADTQHLTLEQHGAYLMLIMNYWQTGKPLRADDQRMACICSTDVENWRKIKPILSEFFHKIDDPDTGIGVWIHQRIEFDLQAVISKSNKCSRAGKKSAAQRAEKKKKSNKRTNKRTNHTDTDTDTDTDKRSTAPPSGARKISPNWQPDTKAIEWVVSHGVTMEQARPVVVEFKAYWESRSQKRKDWNLAFMRNGTVEGSLLRIKNGGSNGQKPIGTTRNDRIEKVLAQDSDPGTGDPRGNVPLLGDSEKTGRE